MKQHKTLSDGEIAHRLSKKLDKKRKREQLPPQGMIEMYYERASWANPK